MTLFFRSVFFSLDLYCRMVCPRTPMRTSMLFISARIVLQASFILTTGEESVIVPECQFVFDSICYSFQLTRRWFQFIYFIELLRLLQWMFSFFSYYDWDLYCQPTSDMLLFICVQDCEIRYNVRVSQSFIFYRQERELGKLYLTLQLLFLYEVAAVLQCVHMRSPLLVILLGGYFKLIANSFALKFPIVLTYGTDNYLFVFVHCSIATRLISIVKLVFFTHFNLVQHLIIIFNFLISLIRFLFF